MNFKTITKLPGLKKLASAAAVLLVTNFSYAQPANDGCGGALAITPEAATSCSSPLSYTTLNATISTTTPSCSSDHSGDVWFSFVAGSAYHKVALSNVVATNSAAADYAFGVAVYSGTCSALTAVNCDIGFNTTFGNDIAELMLGGLTIGNTYYVQIWPDEAYDSNFNPIVNEINFDVCITTPPQGPANDFCNGAEPVTVGATQACSDPVSGSTATATMSGAEASPSCGYEPVSDVWYSFVATAAAHQVELSNVVATNANVEEMGFGIAVYSGTCGTLTELDCSFGFSYALGVDPAQLTLGGLTIGNTYYVQVWSDHAYDSNLDPIANEIDFDLCVYLLQSPPANDLCSGALLLGQGIAVNGDNTNATNDNLSGQPSCGFSGDGIAKGIWYNATPTANGNLTIASCGSSFDTYLRVFSGGDCSAFANCVAYDDNGCGAQATVTFAAVAGTTYYILLGGYDNTEFGPFTITASGVALPVTMDELRGNVIAGNRAQLSWNTYTEENNKGFEVQRSVDGKVFTAAGFVASKGVSGNSKEKIAYSFTDPVAIEGAVFYRLQQTDIDGKKDYSNIIRLGAADAVAFNLVAMPNPVKDRLRVNTYGKTANGAYLLVTDMGGRILQRIPVTAESTDIDMTALTPGIHLLKYTDANRTQMLKISKQ